MGFECGPQDCPPLRGDILGSRPHSGPRARRSPPARFVLDAGPLPRCPTRPPALAGGFYQRPGVGRPGRTLPQLLCAVTRSLARGGHTHALGLANPDGSLPDVRSASVVLLDPAACERRALPWGSTRPAAGGRAACLLPVRTGGGPSLGVPTPEEVGPRLLLGRGAPGGRSGLLWADKLQGKWVRPRMKGLELNFV